MDLAVELRNTETVRSWLCIVDCGGGEAAVVISDVWQYITWQEQPLMEDSDRDQAWYIGERKS